ncbi:CST complex subunit CTC1-like isoform X2 [Asparagus officinalis]|uniref:CST complex subunit CTC1-like isoform X2 n=1 Tax=Asparagus officinalis TaxID=4686 RepID=UPI00098E1B62|nr:CST complex subunit CTC1-like isoform X2 [Asparagus officinalis]
MADDSINGSEEVKKRLKIPCLLTFRSSDGQLCSVPGYLCHTGNTPTGNIIDRQREQRILLEFKADSLFKYQFLQLGGYYILKCSTKRERDTSINSKTNNASEAYEGDVSPGNILLQQSFSQMHKNSDVHVHFFSEEKDMFRIIPEPVEVLSVSSCLHILKAKIGRTSSVADPQCRDMPQGNLISLCGNVEIIQICNYKSRPYMSSNQLDCMDIDQRMCCDIVIHLCNDHHKVLIHGNFRKHMYPVGLGPGANATFHRVLVTCPSSGCPTLVLTPVSFVVINFIKEVAHQHSKERTTPQIEASFAVEESSSIVLGLMSQLTWCLENKLIRCNCRVLTVYALVLERSIHVPSKSQSNNQLKLPALNVALSGFVMDDGSSLSCWWANSLATMRLLRFHETAHRPLLHYSKTSMQCKARNSQDTVGHRLEKMLKKYHRIIVKSDRVSHYSSTPSFTFHVDSGVLSCPDERKLWLVMLDACASPASNIIGRVMDPNSLQLLDTELKELNMTTPSMPNVRITEVGCLNPLHEARNLLHELTS